MHLHLSVGPRNSRVTLDRLRNLAPYTRHLSMGAPNHTDKQPETRAEVEKMNEQTKKEGKKESQGQMQGSKCLRCGRVGGHELDCPRRYRDCWTYGKRKGQTEQA
ncbi:hypothetical protein NW759_007720 [Fusarium solani]|nr:hypothetical protein NW759_007720 [Fusarium solani]